MGSSLTNAPNILEHRIDKMKIMIYIFVGICILSVLISFGIWFFASAFNDTGSGAAQGFFNAVLIWTCIIAAITISLIFLKPGILKNDNTRFIFALVGTIATIIAASSVFWNFSSLDKKIAKEKQSNQIALQKYNVQQQSLIAQLPKDYICNDGSFINAVQNEQNGISFNYYPLGYTSVSGRTLAWSFDKTQKNLTVFDRSSQTREIFTTCKNSQGRSVTDLYTESFINSTNTPTVLPITRDEALELVKGITTIKAELQKNPPAVSVSVISQTYHDGYSNQDIWVVQIQSPPGNNDKPINYYVFVNDGKIIPSP